jgi:hypothetical protein
MHRESTYVCTYTAGEDEHVGHVRAWDDREAAELFAREMELESDVHAISVAEIRVRLVSPGGATARNVAG